jgi:hypothetical protein
LVRKRSAAIGPHVDRVARRVTDAEGGDALGKHSISSSCMPAGA